MSRALGEPVEPSWRTKVANALYEHAKWQPDEINYHLDQFEAEHAHELAEKQRAYARRMEGHPHFEDLAPGGFAAADHIDPEVDDD